MERINYNILIVDDVPKNIQLIGNILKQEGYSLEYATNGEEALEWLKDTSFDLILLDIMMPKMDGYEVCRRIKENPQLKDVPILFLTAKNDIQDIKQAFKIGGADYITKPFNTDELLARVKVHLEIQQKRKELKEANESKDKFFSIIAHDLRNPINAIHGISGLLLRNYGNYEYKDISEYLHLIHESTKKITYLLENLLTWSRVQAGNMPFSPEEINIIDIIKENVMLFEEQAGNKEVKLSFLNGEKHFAVADKFMISTVIRNLISNAIKYTDKGGEVIVYTKLTDDNCLQIRVKDNGVGMSQENIDKIFAENIAITTEGTEKEKGSGLGLTLCKEFVKKNNGKIWAESVLNKGSEFIFTLPLKKG